MQRMWLLTIIHLISVYGLYAQSKIKFFKQTQLNYPIVKASYDKHWQALIDSMKRKKISPDSFSIYIRMFKHEKEMEIWLKTSGDTKYKLFKTFYLCATSGTIGPKRLNKDKQIPEGFYEIVGFNPKDKHKYLPLKINYPNPVDRAIAQEPIATNIFIHGTCETNGDIVIDKNDMEQLYILCVEAKNRKEFLYIDIYPCRFSKSNEDLLINNNKKNVKFWQNIKDAYLYFEEHHWLPRVDATDKGEYIYQE